MSSINPEMLKQLLSEFEEKQAVCREEINEINNQIKELELRIESSKERLVSVARDREKIGLMKQRYQDGDWSAVLSQIQKSSNGAGAPAKPAVIDQPMAQTGDYPPVSLPPVEAAPVAAKSDSPPANLAPQSVIAPPPAQEFPPSFISEPAPAPVVPAPVAEVPAPDFSMPAAAAAPEAAPSNPFEQAPPAPVATAPNMQIDVNWETPQPFQAEAPAAAPAPTPAPAPSEGLFSFSGQPAPDAAGGAEIPWAPPPTMSWESVGNHTFPQGAPDPSQQFPPAQQQQQPPAFQSTPPGFPESAAFGGGQPPPFGQPDMPAPGGFPDPSQGAPPGPPGGFMTPPSTPVPPPSNQAVLTTAFDDEFDISDALRGEDDSANSDSRDNDKKIKDALRGLFS